MNAWMKMKLRKNVVITWFLCGCFVFGFDIALIEYQEFGVGWHRAKKPHHPLSVGSNAKITMPKKEEEKKYPIKNWIHMMNSLLKWWTNEPRSHFICQNHFHCNCWVGNKSNRKCYFNWFISKIITKTAYQIIRSEKFSLSLNNYVCLHKVFKTFVYLNT